MAKQSGLGWLFIPAEVMADEAERIKARWQQQFTTRGVNGVIKEHTVYPLPAYRPMSTPTLAGITAWVACPRCGWAHYALIIVRWRDTVTRECQECGQRFYQTDKPRT